MNTDKLKSLNEKFRKLKISFDVDQVEVDSATSALSRVNYLLNTQYSPTDLTEYWGLTLLLKRDHKEILNPEKYAVNIWNDPEIIGNALPVPGSSVLSKHLVENGINAYRITSRPSTLSKITHEWYERNMPWVDRSLIHIQKDGSEIASDFKANKIHELNIDYHFEDSYEHALEITSKGNTKVILVPQPWNEYFTPEAGGRIIKIPKDNAYSTLPKLLQVYQCLSDIII